MGLYDNESNSTAHLETGMLRERKRLDAAAARRPWKIATYASVALNILLILALIGYYYRAPITLSPFGGQQREPMTYDIYSLRFNYQPFGKDPAASSTTFPSPDRAKLDLVAADPPSRRRWLG